MRNNQGFHRLIDTYENYGSEGDELLLTSTWIEDQLQQMGAKQGKDYTYLDIAKLAMEHINTLIIKESIESMSRSIDLASTSLDGAAKAFDDIAHGVQGYDTISPYTQSKNKSKESEN